MACEAGACCGPASSASCPPAAALGGRGAPAAPRRRSPQWRLLLGAAAAAAALHLHAAILARANGAHRGLLFAGGRPAAHHVAPGALERALRSLAARAAGGNSDELAISDDLVVREEAVDDVDQGRDRRPGRGQPHVRKAKLPPGFWDRRDLAQVDIGKLDKEGDLSSMSLADLESYVTNSKARGKRLRSSRPTRPWQKSQPAESAPGPKAQVQERVGFADRSPEPAAQRQRQRKPTPPPSAAKAQLPPVEEWRQQDGGASPPSASRAWDQEVEDEQDVAWHDEGQQDEDDDGQSDPGGEWQRPWAQRPAKAEEGPAAPGDDVLPKVVVKRKEFDQVKVREKKRGFDNWLMPKGSVPKSPNTGDGHRGKKRGEKDDSADIMLNKELNLAGKGRDQKLVEDRSTFSKMHRSVFRIFAPLPWETVEKANCLTDPANESWADLGIDGPHVEQMIKVMVERGVEGPNQLQATMVPGILEGKDTLLTSQTGSGKTLAFLLPLLHRHVLSLADVDIRMKIDPRIPHHMRPKQLSRPRLMVVAPTKELAAQIYRIVKDLLTPFPLLNATLLIGGAGHQTQDTKLKDRQPVVVVGTPGRIMDHHEEGRLRFDALKAVVLDEIDAMLAMSRLDHMTMLVAATFDVPQVQKVLASATGSASHDTELFAQKHLHGDFHDSPYLSVEMPPRVLHLVNGAPDIEKKLLFLQRLVKSDPEPNGILVFCNNNGRADKVARSLNYMKVDCRVLGNDRSAGSRQKAVEMMNDGKIGMLISTDLAARGIDWREITHVVNFELPGDAHTYAHRAGRVGRAGFNGIVISLAGGGPSNTRLKHYEKELGITLHECDASAGCLQLVVGRKRRRLAKPRVES